MTRTHEAGMAPKVILEACDIAALQVVSLDTLKQYATAPAH